MLIEVQMRTNLIVEGYEPPAIEVISKLVGDFTVIQDPYGTGDRWYSIVEPNWHQVTVEDWEGNDITSLVDPVVMRIMENELVDLAIKEV